MSRTKSFDDAEVVRAARDCFWTKGYPDTSITDLERVTGLNRSSIYSAYGSKRKLFARAVEDYLHDITHPTLARLEAEGAGRDELVAYFLDQAGTVRGFARGNQTQGCLILNTVVELTGMDKDAAEVVREYRRRIKLAFLHALETMPESVADPDSQAELLLLSHVGVLVSSKVDAEGAAHQAELQARQIRSW
jgi:AcrR family transcriptional regulator